MSKIVIILLLSPGVFSLLDSDNVERVATPEVENDKLDEAAVANEAGTPKGKASTDVDTKRTDPPKKKNKVGLNKEQIDMLAEKVIRIHDVDLNRNDEENQKNIGELRKVVANVEKDLNEKLRLTQAKIKANTNSNGKDTANEQITAQIQNENEKPVENPDQNVPKADKPEQLNENVEDKGKKIDGLQDAGNERAVEATNAANEDIDTDTEDADQTLEDITEADSDKEEEEEIKTNDNKLDENESPVTDATESDAENGDDITQTNDEEESDDNYNFERNEDDDTTEDEAEQDDFNEDVNETTFVESTAENHSEIEDEIPGACNLNDGCDEADNTHSYSEDYNSEKIVDQELEVEDSHLQRLIKYVASFF